MARTFVHDFSKISLFLNSDQKDLIKNMKLVICWSNLFKNYSVKLLIHIVIGTDVNLYHIVQFTRIIYHVSII